MRDFRRQRYKKKLCLIALLRESAKRVGLNIEKKRVPHGVLFFWALDAMRFSV
jgi:hypothetical protein